MSKSSCVSLNSDQPDCVFLNYFHYFYGYVVGNQKNRLNETVLLNTHTIKKYVYKMDIPKNESSFAPISSIRVY